MSQDRSSPAGAVPLRGTALRSALVLTLRASGVPMTVRQLVTALARRGLAPVGRPSKAISDALRWECRRGRVRRLDRATYVVGYVARSTAFDMRQRVRAQVQGARAAADPAASRHGPPGHRPSTPG